MPEPAMFCSENPIENKVGLFHCPSFQESVFHHEIVELVSTLIILQCDESFSREARKDRKEEGRKEEPLAKHAKSAKVKGNIAI